MYSTIGLNFLKVRNLDHTKLALLLSQHTNLFWQTLQTKLTAQSHAYVCANRPNCLDWCMITVYFCEKRWIKTQLADSNREKWNIQHESLCSLRKGMCMCYTKLRSAFSKGRMELVFQILSRFDHRRERYCFSLGCCAFANYNIQFRRS